MSRRAVLVSVVVVLLVVAAGAAGGWVLLDRRADQQKRDAAASFARAWAGGTLQGLTYAGGADAATVAKTVKTETAQLTTATADHPDSVDVASVRDTDGGAEAGLRVTWTLAGERVWRYDTTLPLQKVGGEWRPRFSPAVVHPRLVAGSVLKATVEQPQRGRIIGAGDQVLVEDRPVVDVGFVPGRADDVAADAQRIAGIVGVDGAGLVARARAARPDALVPVITLRRTAYARVRTRLHPIPGAVFAERSLSLAPTSDFARALLGTVGEATADAIKASNGRVQAGDQTGLSGLQQAQDETLAGKPGLTVTAAPTKGGTGTTLFSAKAENGKDLHITLDEKTQEAADAAVAKASKPAGMVVLRPGTGEILAVANGGPNASGYDRALLGQYPPGSTFKIVSSLALLQHGITPATTVQCPGSLVISGKTFTNAEDEKLGAAPFHRDFADSCNTAFVGSSTKITADQLDAAAKAMGYNRTADIGVPAFSGKAPRSDEAVAHAATMIGQAQVLASPLTVAGTSAAVAAGTYAPPTLLAAEDGAAPRTTALPGGVVRDLRSLMREVVTSGTGTALRSVPGAPVSGKTGTAEYGDDDPPRTHAWFTGYQGDVAFAVVVEDGGFGAEAAAPIAADFLKRLAG